jgi:hypothetical protein
MSSQQPAHMDVRAKPQGKLASFLMDLLPTNADRRALAAPLPNSIGLEAFRVANFHRSLDWKRYLRTCTALLGGLFFVCKFSQSQFGVGAAALCVLISFSVITIMNYKMMVPLTRDYLRVDTNSCESATTAFLDGNPANIGRRKLFEILIPLRSGDFQRICYSWEPTCVTDELIRYISSYISSRVSLHQYGDAWWMEDIHTGTRLDHKLTFVDARITEGSRWVVRLNQPF